MISIISAKGQVTLFIIIGLMILIIVGSLLYALPRWFVPVAKEPLPLGLQRCIDTAFAESIQEVAERGGTEPCVAYQSTALGREVCTGLLRNFPITGTNIEDVVTYTSSLRYGQGSSLIDRRKLRDNIQTLSESSIISDCSDQYNDARNFNVEFTDRQTLLRFDLKRNEESGFERFEVRMDVPLREMWRIMESELLKSRRSYDSGGSSQIWGLTHSFQDTVIDPRYNLAHAYVNEDAQENHLFYIETTNDPLPLEADKNVRFATIIEDRFPVINYDANTKTQKAISCSGIDYIHIIDPDEGQRTSNIKYEFDPEECNVGIEATLTLHAADKTETIQIIQVGP